MADLNESIKISTVKIAKITVTLKHMFKINSYVVLCYHFDNSCHN